MTRSNVRKHRADGVTTHYPALDHGRRVYRQCGARGIKVDLHQCLARHGAETRHQWPHVHPRSGQEGILAIKLGGSVQINGVSVDHAGPSAST